jgi:hypothetical protein
LLIVEDTLSEELQKQRLILQQEKTGSTERKLLVYIITPQAFLEEIHEEEWIPSTKLYQQFRTPGEDFEIVLIGLDGSVKMRATETITAGELFSVIDAMPMRRQEIEHIQK